MAKSSKVLLLLMSLGSMQQQGVLGETCMVLGSVTQPPKNGQAVFIASPEGPSLEGGTASKGIMT